MAFTRYGVEVYSTLEINRAAFLTDGQIVSQKALDDVFTKTSPCENGMWLNANRAQAALAPITNPMDQIGIVYTTELEPGHERGLKYHKNVGGDYPRVGVLEPGDVFTTNCFGYENAEFVDDAAVDTALAALATIPLYLVPVVGNPVPQLTAIVPTAGTYAQVIRPFTVPNGEKAIHYTIIRTQ